MQIPAIIDQAMHQGATLVISVSGGKDSQAMQHALVLAAHERGWPLGNLMAMHCDLGRMEWPQSLPHCQALADSDGIPLVVVRREEDLLAGIQARQRKLAGTGKPFWPDARNRYCTSGWKRDVADKFIRGLETSLVISAEGIRDEESPARARRRALTLRERVCTAQYRGRSPEDVLAAWTSDSPGRLAFTWYPIKDWGIEEVWRACGTSSAALEAARLAYAQSGEISPLSWPAHPAYLYGNQRVSCAVCVLASAGDIRNGLRHNPDLARQLLSMEKESGVAFQNRRSLAALLDQDLKDWPHYWRVKTRLPERQGQSCRILVTGARNTVLVEFKDGHRVTTSRYYVRRRQPAGSAP